LEGRFHTYNLTLPTPRFGSRAPPPDDLIPQRPSGADHPAGLEGLDLRPAYQPIKAVEGRPARAPIDPMTLPASRPYATGERIAGRRHREEPRRDHAASRSSAGDLTTSYHTRADFRTDPAESPEDPLTLSVATPPARVDRSRPARLMAPGH
jgi:hypothetical protein